jgi:prepilin-type processing-associated H-X9-DG protein
VNLNRVMMARLWSPRPVLRKRVSVRGLGERTQLRRRERTLTPALSRIIGRGSVGSGAFTLVELLVVLGITTVLIAMLLPTLSIARESARSAACASNLRQLHLASMLYANDNRGFLPPAHLDFITKNLHRWHGMRATVDEPFDFNGSLLKRYLQTPQIKKCPSFEFTPGGFEASAGGYGYNDHYLGSSMEEPAPMGLGLQAYEAQFVNAPARLSTIHRPAETIAFADAAFACPNLIEYSFLEPPLTGSGPADPSIHFRHRGRANVVWLDGHISSQRMEWTYPVNIHGAANAPMHLGYFGPRDNTLFDRR